MRRNIGLALAIGGAALAWLLKEKLTKQRRVHRRPIVLVEKGKQCGIREQPSDVTMRRDEHLHWVITNSASDGDACDEAIEVCIGWRAGVPLEVIGGGRFCRTVRPGQTKTLPARVKDGIADGQYHYDVLIDGHVAMDPMVEIVL